MIMECANYCNPYIRNLICEVLKESPIPLSTKQICKRVEQRQQPGLGAARNGIRREIDNMIEDGLVRITYQGKTNTDVALVKS